MGGATFDGSRGEKQDVMAYALKTFNVTDISRAVMIGDRKFDIEGAKYFRMDSIGVTYGYGSKEELEKEGAPYIVDRPLDILELL